MIIDILYNIIENSQCLDNYIKMASLNKEINKYSKKPCVLKKIISNKCFKNDCTEKMRKILRDSDYIKLQEILKLYQNKSTLQKIFIDDIISNRYLRLSNLGKDVINFLCEILFFDSEFVNLNFFDIGKIYFYLYTGTYGRYKYGLSFINSNIILNNYSDVISYHFTNLKKINKNIYHQKLHAFIQEYVKYTAEYLYTSIDSKIMLKILMTISNTNDSFREDIKNYLTQEILSICNKSPDSNEFRETFGDSYDTICELYRTFEINGRNNNL